MNPLAEIQRFVEDMYEALAGTDADESFDETEWAESLESLLRRIAIHYPAAD